jgi:hypothetical protein
MTRPTHEQKLNAAYLSACSPQAAYEWLKWSAPKNNAEASRNLWSSDSKFEEYVLLRRFERLIDLGIARYGRDAKIVRRAFLRGNAGARIAAWSNISMHLFSPAGIWATKDDLQALLARKNIAEITAFATNPSLKGTTLEDLMLRKGDFSGLSDGIYAQVLYSLGNNPRMAEVYGDERSMDGYALVSHNKPFKVAWGLAALLPTDGVWPAILEHLLARCPTASYKPEEAWQMIERWRLDTPKVPGEKQYYPGPSFRIRSRLADLLKADDSLLKSEDLALRLSYYRRFSLYKNKDWDDDIRHEFDIGEKEPIYAAMENPELWVTSESREKLSELAWAAPDEHKLLAPNLFYGKLRAHREKNPRLPELSSEPKPAWVDDILIRVESLQGEMELLSRSVSQPAMRAAQPASKTKLIKGIGVYIPLLLWLTIALFAGKILLAH